MFCEKIVFLSQLKASDFIFLHGLQDENSENFSFNFYVLFKYMYDCIWNLSEIHV